MVALIDEIKKSLSTPGIDVEGVVYNAFQHANHLLNICGSFISNQILKVTIHIWMEPVLVSDDGIVFIKLAFYDHSDNLLVIREMVFVIIFLNKFGNAFSDRIDRVVYVFIYDLN